MLGGPKEGLDLTDVLLGYVKKECSSSLFGFSLLEVLLGSVAEWLVMLSDLLGVFIARFFFLLLLEDVGSKLGCVIVDFDPLELVLFF